MGINNITMIKIKSTFYQEYSEPAKLYDLHEYYFYVVHRIFE